MAQPVNAEQRLEKLELQLSDWQAAVRVRFQAVKSLQTRAADLDKSSSRELWRLKLNLGESLWDDFQNALGSTLPAEGLTTMGAEFNQVFNRDSEIVGIFPVGGGLSGAHVWDVRFRPSFQGCEPPR